MNVSLVWYVYSICKRFTVLSINVYSNKTNNMNLCFPLHCCHRKGPIRHGSSVCSQRVQPGLLCLCELFLLRQAKPCPFLHPHTAAWSCSLDWSSVSLRSALVLTFDSDKHVLLRQTSSPLKATSSTIYYSNGEVEVAVSRREQLLHCMLDRSKEHHE